MSSLNQGPLPNNGWNLAFGPVTPGAEPGPAQGRTEVTHNVVLKKGGNKMRLPILILLVASVTSLHGCSECEGPTEIDPDLNIVQFHGDMYRCTEVECSVGSTEGGPPTYMLRIALETDSGARFAFSVQDSGNSIDNLLTKGTHVATGGPRDGISTFLPDQVSYSMSGLTAEDLEIAWGKIITTGTAFSGLGYVHIKREIHFECADSIWVGGRFVKPGDPEYEHYYETFCVPDFYYPRQKIGFVCADGEISQ